MFIGDTKILSSDNYDSLVLEINHHITLGWERISEITVSTDFKSTSCLFYHTVKSNNKYQCILRKVKLVDGILEGYNELVLPTRIFDIEILNFEDNVLTIKVLDQDIKYYLDWSYRSYVLNNIHHDIRGTIYQGNIKKDFKLRHEVKQSITLNGCFPIEVNKENNRVTLSIDYII